MWGVVTCMGVVASAGNLCVGCGHMYGCGHKYRESQFGVWSQVWSHRCLLGFAQ